MEKTNSHSLYQYIHEIFYRQDYQTGNVHELIELAVYSAAAFFTPMFLSSHQFVTGIVVNAALVLAAYNLRGIKLLPVIFFPSLGVLAGGLIFGDLTSYVLYLLPFIWIGNALIVAEFKWLQLNHAFPFFFVLWMAAAAKTAVILGAVLAFVYLTLVPVQFISMGMLQLFTALIGGASAFVVQKGKSRFLGKQ